MIAKNTLSEKCLDGVSSYNEYSIIDIESFLISYTMFSYIK